MFLVKICVLVNSNTNLPRTYNNRFVAGIWCQNIVKDSDWFGRSSIIMDFALVFNMKRVSDKSISKDLDSSPGFTKKCFTNLESLSWAKMQSILKGSNIPTFVPLPHSLCVNASSRGGIGPDWVNSSDPNNSLTAQYVKVPPPQANVLGKPNYEMDRFGSLANCNNHISLDNPFISLDDHLIAQVQNLVNNNNITVDSDTIDRVITSIDNDLVKMNKDLFAFPTANPFEVLDLDKEVDKVNKIPGVSEIPLGSGGRLTLIQSPLSL